MIFRTSLGLLIVLINFSCAQQPSKNGQQIEDGTNQQPQKSGLQIESGGRQGIPFPDFKRGYGYKTFTITNDTTVPIHLRMALSDEFQQPSPFDDSKFKIFLLPQERTPETVTFGDGMSLELGNFMVKNLDTPSIFNKTLEPGGKCDVTIVMLKSRSGDCGVRMYLVQNDSGIFPQCDSLINQNMSANPIATLGLKIDFTYLYNPNPEGCIIIPWGQISYPEH